MPMMINGMRVWPSSYYQKQVQARRHRKKRINKKWLKKYGYTWVPNLDAVHVADVPGYGKVLICHPKMVDKLEAAIRRQVEVR